MAQHVERSGPLAGCRVLELGSTVAGPFCGRLMADFGAEVVKVEPPAGDPVRSMGRHLDGVSLYTASLFRNKRLIAVDLSRPRGRDVIRALVPRFDIIIENFRPGTLEKWGLGYAELAATHPALVMVRISGFGQDGPYCGRPGYGFLGDAMSGFLSINGFPDRPPVRAAVPVTDMVTALYGAYGAVIALLARKSTGRGQCIDAALYEAAFSLMESHVPAFDKLKVAPNRAGSRLPGSTPNNLYPVADGEVIAIAAASDSIFKRLADAICRPELSTDPRFSTALARVRYEDEIDAVIATWTRTRTAREVEATLRSADVPVSRVFTVADVFKDPHYLARNMIVRVQSDEHELGDVAMVAPVPKLSETPAEIRWAGRRIGQDTRAILSELGGLNAIEIATLEADRIIRSDPGTD